MQPTIGRTVLYRLNASDAERINEARQEARRRFVDLDVAMQRHDGQHEERTGQVVSVVVTRVWNDTMINGQAFLDGNDSLWVTSVEQGDGHGQWSWPPRAESQKES